MCYLFIQFQNGVGGDHRTEDQRTHVRQFDDRRMRLGSAAWRFRVSQTRMKSNNNNVKVSIIGSQVALRNNVSAYS